MCVPYAEELETDVKAECEKLGAVEKVGGSCAHTGQQGVGGVVGVGRYVNMVAPVHSGTWTGLTVFTLREWGAT